MGGDLRVIGKSLTLIVSDWTSDGEVMSKCWVNDGQVTGKPMGE